MLRARLPLNRVLVLCSCISILCSALDPPSVGRPASPFIGDRKAQVIEKEKEKNEKEKNASRVAGSFFSFMRVPPIL